MLQNKEENGSGKSTDEIVSFGSQERSLITWWLMGG